MIMIFYKLPNYNFKDNLFHEQWNFSYMNPMGLILVKMSLKQYRK